MMNRNVLHLFFPSRKYNIIIFHSILKDILPKSSKTEVHFSWKTTTKRGFINKTNIPIPTLPHSYPHSNTLPFSGVFHCRSATAVFSVTSHQIPYPSAVPSHRSISDTQTILFQTFLSKDMPNLLHIHPYFLSSSSIASNSHLFFNLFHFIPIQ